jgi:hypothetical protein
MVRADGNRTTRFAGIVLRRPAYVPPALLVVMGLWIGTGPWLLRGSTSFDITIEHAHPQWAVEWQPVAGVRMAAAGERSHDANDG